ncbi:hypothetical protein [Nocardia sp. NBC_01327]|uniref:hypothetical protein n=1 Tax=Nocardia sp. NBC_01327 TaxID=2903593 RepID=UPI002E124A1A|nr:hypothetical protein OG326_24230 [Nocardia sp. NBC_01327]
MSTDEFRSSTDPCEHCGCSPWDTRLAERYERTSERLQRAYEHQAAVHGVAAAQWHLKELENADAHSGFQRKVAEQRRTIRRLESKLRKLGVPPYAKDVEQVTE